MLKRVISGGRRTVVHQVRLGFHPFDPAFQVLEARHCFRTVHPADIFLGPFFVLCLALALDQDPFLFLGAGQFALQRTDILVVLLDQGSMLRYLRSQ